jgi:hypothetical protein
LNFIISPPSGDLGGKQKKAEKKIEFKGAAKIMTLEKGAFPGIKNGRRKVFFPAPGIIM